MTAAARLDPGRVLVELRDVDVDTMSGRPLIRGLSACLATGDRAALVGRNGVGKSTLLSLIAGLSPPARGHVILHTSPGLVPQRLDDASTRALAERLRDEARGDPRRRARLSAALAGAGLPELGALIDAPALSGGERRKLHLAAARLAAPALLLLDEPTQDLDADGQRWLETWLFDHPGALLVATHSRRLLARFQHFFLLEEAGCRHLPGSFAALEEQLRREDDACQRRYVEGLNALDERERHHWRVSQRRRRKKNVGRLHELRRRTSRARLNEKRGYAQESQARAAKIRADRIDAARGWARALRRALQVHLPLDAAFPRLPPPGDAPLLSLRDVGVRLGGRLLFRGIDLALTRQRVAVIGPNGSGKTTLLRVMLGERAPTEGVAALHDRARVGVIAQDGDDWRRDESLLEHLLDASAATTLDDAAALLVAHRFPLALAERPLCELSPGERVRAALICLARRRPPVEVLVLDEPTRGLDFVGQAALTAALAAWPGGLVIVSHDAALLDAIGIDATIELGAARGVPASQVDDMPIRT